MGILFNPEHLEIVVNLKDESKYLINWIDYMRFLAKFMYTPEDCNTNKEFINNCKDYGITYKEYKPKSKETKKKHWW